MYIKYYLVFKSVSIHFKQEYSSRSDNEYDKTVA